VTASEANGRDEAAFAADEVLRWPGNYTAVTVPAHRDFVASIRALTRSSAALADLTLDDVEELQIAVDEAATLLLPLVDPAARWLRARFDIAPGRLLTNLSLDCRPGYRLDRSSLAWVMLTAVDPGVAIVEDGSHVTITIERGRSGSST
jgi:serine/threonine-protein kinase RsbW